MIKIYFDQRFLLLTDKDTDDNQNSFDLYYKFLTESDFVSLLSIFRDTPVIKTFCVYAEDLDALFTCVKSQFKILAAAGGLVRNTKGEVLLIYRREKWDLPKGKIEKGEAIEEAALREVEEECGISGVELQEKLLTTYHTYFHKNKWILKPTYWFSMKYEGDSELIPQLEEEITEVVWGDEEAVEKLKENTFPSILDVVEEELSRKK